MAELLADRGVLFLISGNRHLNVLVVAIHSLRKSGWQGSIHIACGDDAAEPVVRMIAKDERLRGYGDITWKRWKKPDEQRNDKYRQKTFMDQLTLFEQTVYLDADTLVLGSIEPLFQFGPHAVTLTQFSDWSSNGRKIPNRILPWRDVAPADVDEMISKPYPAINTGVMAFDRSEASQKFFQEWRELTAKRICFICDELSCQLIFHRHACRVLDDRWNASPIHSERARGGQAVILHGHGFKFIKRDQGRAIWWPWYDECVKQNIAGLADWTPGGDKHLRAVLEGSRDGAGTPDDEETAPCHEDEEALL